MTKADRGKTGCEEKLYADVYETTLGKITMFSDGEALKGLWLPGQHGPDWLAEARFDSSLPVFDETKAWLDDYFAGRRPQKSPILAPEGSDFQRRVWELLREIPYGETRTYGDLAEQIAQERGMKRMAAQAVGGAVGRNPISILIPCHRVIGKDGSLVGYDGGLDKKIALLGIEGWLDPKVYGQERICFPTAETPGCISE